MAAAAVAPSPRCAVGSQSGRRVTLRRGKHLVEAAELQPPPQQHHVVGCHRRRELCDPVDGGGVGVGVGPQDGDGILAAAGAE